MNIAVIVAHPDDAEIWMGGTLLAYQHRANAAITIIYPLPTSGARMKEATDARFRSVFTSNLRESVVTIQPSVIFTHWARDSHPEHVRVFELVERELPEIIVFDGLRPRVFSFGTYNNLGRDGAVFTPTDFVDTSPYFEEKLALIRAYPSQDPEMWIRMMEPVNHLWGSQCGVMFAEGFRELPVLGITRRARALL